MIADAVNASFELAGSLFVLNHCRVLYRHKSVRGVSKMSVTFFLLWGVWNIWYYPHLGQMLSFMAGIALATANCLYVGMLIGYSHRERRSSAADDRDLLGA